MACLRAFKDGDFTTFEKNVSPRLMASGETLLIIMLYIQVEKRMKEKDTDDDCQEQMASWQKDLANKQSLRPVQVAHDNLKSYEIPLLENEIKEMESEHPDIVAEAERVGLHLNLHQLAYPN